MKAIELESARLLFEPLSTKHLSSAYVNWMNDAETIEFLESGGDYTYEKLKDYLTAVEKKEMLFWAIRKKSNNQHIGNIKIDPVTTKHKRGEYGILIGNKSDWGMGYGKEEATVRILQFCFGQLSLRKVTLGVVADNRRAVQLYERIGFEMEGKYHEHCCFNGRFCDVIRMSMFSRNFKDAG